MARTVLPIFPLPELSFFPHTLLPLHVFEARYRAMITDCLARDKRMAVVGLKPGYEQDYDRRPAVYEIAGAGRIVRCERLATGRFNILLKGEARVRIDRELPSDTLYRMVEGTTLGETGAEREGVGALASRVTGRCLSILRAVQRPTAELEVAISGAAPGAVCDRIASAVIAEAPLRQALLEELDVERRLSRLAEILDDLHGRLQGKR